MMEVVLALLLATYFVVIFFLCRRMCDIERRMDDMNGSLTLRDDNIVEGMRRLEKRVDKLSKKDKVL